MWRSKKPKKTSITFPVLTSPLFTNLALNQKAYTNIAIITNCQTARHAPHPRASWSGRGRGRAVRGWCFDSGYGGYVAVCWGCCRWCFGALGGEAKAWERAWIRMGTVERMTRVR